MNSLRHRLTLLLVAGLAILISAGAALLYPTARRAIVAEYDYALLAKVRALTTLSGTDRQGVSLQFTERILPEFQPGPEAEYFQVWLRDGSVLARSPSLAEADLMRPGSSTAQPQFWNLTLPDGRPGRAVGIGLYSESGKTRTEPDFNVVFAREREHLDGTMARLLTGIILGGLVLMLIVGWLVQRSVRIGLRPVEALAERVMTVRAESLDTRFSGGLPQELRPIAEQLDQLLDRLGAAFERERRFSANAAHELVTPIAELRALAEVALRSPGASEVSLAQDALDISRKMQHRVEALLALARSESASQQTRKQPVNLTQLIEETVRIYTPRAAARDIQLQFSLAPALTFKTDPVMFRSVIMNLVENAVEYSSIGGEVFGRLEDRFGGFVFVLANTTDNLSAADLPYLFEPLWRKDSARSDRSHAGLGLALVKAMAQSLGLEIHAEMIHSTRLQMTLRSSQNASISSE